jgi:hypothetical protein
MSRSVKARRTNGKRFGPNVEPDGANASDGFSIVHFRTEWCRELMLHYSGIDTKIDEVAAPNRSVNLRYLHVLASV